MTLMTCSNIEGFLGVGEKHNTFNATDGERHVNILIFWIKKNAVQHPEKNNDNNKIFLRTFIGIL